MSTLTFNRDLPVRQEVDVLVAGGGPAGIAAALAAARQGASVFLVEGHSCFGGLGTAGLVPMFCPFGDSVHFYAAGIGSEVYGLLYDRGATLSPRGSLAPIIQAEGLKRLYDDLIVASGCDYLLQTQVLGVQQDGPRLTHVICAAKSGLFALGAKVFVDCTGDGDLCAWGGAPYELGDPGGALMPGTLCSLWTGIDWQRAHAFRAQGGGDESQLDRAIADGVFTYPDRHLPGMFPASPQVGAGNVGHLFGVDGTDERSLTAALLWGRHSLAEYERYYKAYLQGFEGMELVATASLAGIRETRRIMGDYVLGFADFQQQTTFPDEIGRFNYCVDIHAATTDPEAQAQARYELENLRYHPGESYGVPYRSLLPRGLDNVLVAGRCLSADRAMQSSIRIMPGCFITGQAAGLAAALAAQGNGETRGVSVAELQGGLRRIGAYLPEG